MKTVPLADVLWRAANKWLLEKEAGFLDRPLDFSCNAAMAAEQGHANIGCFLPSKRELSKTLRFLEQLGCDSGDGNAWGRAYFVKGHELQGVRYMWLLLAMHVAADENIMVEIAQ